MSKKLDLTGQKFGRLTVIKDSGRNKHGLVIWKCKCSCGNIVPVSSNNLRKNNTKSCGCLNIDKIKERSTTHGMSRKLTYQIWGNMIQRCTNPKNQYYCNYGGRGITVSPGWLNFDIFYKDMGNPPKGLTLERRDNNIGYNKDNCYYATRTEQARNRRVSRKNLSGVKGVYFNKIKKKWEIEIKSNGIRYFLGSFINLEEAKNVRLKAERKYWHKNYQ